MTTARRARSIALVLVAAAGGAFALARHERQASRTPAPTAPTETLPERPRRAPEVAVTSEPAASTPRATTSPAPPPPMDEPALMTLLRSASGNDPALAIEIARDGNRRFPDSPDAPERSSILIHALADLGRSSEARGEAERMVNHYPDSRWVREVEAFTGAHRHRNVVLDDQGRLRFVDPPPG